MLKKQNNKQILLLQTKNIDKNLLIQNKSSIFAAILLQIIVHYVTRAAIFITSE